MNFHKFFNFRAVLRQFVKISGIFNHYRKSCSVPPSCQYRWACVNASRSLICHHFSVLRVQEYFVWSSRVVQGLRGTCPPLEQLLDQLFEKRGVLGTTAQQ